MKKTKIIKYLMTSLLLVFTTTMAFSQSFIGIDLNPYSHFFMSISSLIPLVAAISELLFKYVTINKKIWKQVISWGIGIGLSLGAHFLTLGVLGGLTIIEVIIFGFLAGLGSNGFYDGVKNFFKEKLN